MTPKNVQKSFEMYDVSFEMYVWFGKNVQQAFGTIRSDPGNMYNTLVESEDVTLAKKYKSLLEYIGRDPAKMYKSPLEL